MSWFTDLLKPDMLKMDMLKLNRLMVYRLAETRHVQSGHVETEPSHGLQTCWNQTCSKWTCWNWTISWFTDLLKPDMLKVDMLKLNLLMVYRLAETRHVETEPSHGIQTFWNQTCWKWTPLGSKRFCFQTEAPMLLRPFLNHMTRSELHTVMTCGFASISGGILGTYVQFGVPVSYSFLSYCTECNYNNSGDDRHYHNVLHHRHNKPVWLKFWLQGK